jgi:hypothetical protein
MVQEVYGKNPLESVLEDLRFHKNDVTKFYGSKHCRCRVLYWKDIKWLTNLTLALAGMESEAIPNREDIAKDYEIVADFETWANNPEQIWQAMNLEPDRYFIKEAYSRGVGHTSMSVGDIVILGDKAFITISVGFKEIPKRLYS